jgi:hypothetical protein
MTKIGRHEASKSRLERLEQATAKGLYPTTQGNRKAETSGGKVTSPPNKFKQSDDAVEGVKARRRYPKSE